MAPPYLPAWQILNGDFRKNGSFSQDLLINADAQTKLVGLRVLTILSVVPGFAFLFFIDFVVFLGTLFR